MRDETTWDVQQRFWKMQESVRDLGQMASSWRLCWAIDYHHGVTRIIAEHAREAKVLAAELNALAVALEMAHEAQEAWRKKNEREHKR